jgi:hypothetical protein
MKEDRAASGGSGSINRIIRKSLWTWTPQGGLPERGVLWFQAGHESMNQCLCKHWQPRSRVIRTGREWSYETRIAAFRNGNKRNAFLALCMCWAPGGCYVSEREEIKEFLAWGSRNRSVQPIHLFMDSIMKHLLSTNYFWAMGKHWECS